MLMMNRPRPSASNTGLRFVLPLVMLSTLATFVALLTWAAPVYNDMLNAMGVTPGTVPFVDWVFISASVECWKNGVDVFLTNPCDPLGRAMDYSPLWLRATFLPNSEPWLSLCGLLANLIFIGSVLLLPTPRSLAGVTIMVLCGVSSFTLIAMERGNVDILMFALVVCATCLWFGSLPERLIGYALIVLATLLKFYPIVALVLAAKESMRNLVLVAVIAVLIMFGSFWYFHDELLGAFRNVPSGSYFSGGLFGARNLPYGLVLLADHARIDVNFAPSVSAGGIIAKMVSPDGWGAKLLEAIFILSSVYLSLAVARRLALASLIRSLSEREAAFLMAGTAVIVGCFFAGQNVTYRGIFFILTMPGLIALAALAKCAGRRRYLMGTCLLIVVLMMEPALNRFISQLSGEGDRHGAAYLVLWLVRECGWWWTIIVFDAVLFCLLSQRMTLRKLMPARILAHLETF